MTATLYTYYDAVSYLLDRFDLYNGGSPDDRALRLAKRAVMNAYRELPNLHKWKYFQRSISLWTEASYTTGTIAYTASTRAVTLSGGTWPANAALGEIRVGNNVWFVTSRDSDTQVTIRAEGAPPADVAAGTSYEWYRSSYPLPCRVRRLIGSPWDVADNCPLTFVSEATRMLTDFGSGVHTSSEPSYCSIGNSDRYINTQELSFSPPPESARQYMLKALVEPRPIGAAYYYATGTATVAPGSSTCTLTGGVFDTANHFGALIRFGSAATLPTPPEGDLAGNVNPAAYERRIIDVGTTTTCTLDAAITAGVTGVKFTISDPLDLMISSMQTYFWSLCEYQFAKVWYRDEPQRYGIFSRREDEERKFAKNADRSFDGLEAMNYFGIAGFGDYVGTVSPVTEPS